jgi:large subunit ribosomal protein L15
VAISGYEGGQMPLYMRLPKRGFNKPNRKEYTVVNLGLIQKFIDAADRRGPAHHRGAPRSSGVLRRSRDGIRVLAKGEITAQVDHRGHRRLGGRGRGRRGQGGTLRSSGAEGRGGHRGVSRRGRPLARGPLADRVTSRRRRLGSAALSLHGEHDGVRCGTDGLQHELVGLRQGDRAQATHPLHDRASDRLPDRHLYPGPWHRRERAARLHGAGGRRIGGILSMFTAAR